MTNLVKNKDYKQGTRHAWLETGANDRPKERTKNSFE